MRRLIILLDEVESSEEEFDPASKNKPEEEIYNS